MSQTSSLMVAVFDRVVCIKVCGKADFTSSLDLRKLITELWERGYVRFVFELCDCVTMSDSTFLGTLSGLGVDFGNGHRPQSPTLELFNPNPRIADVLESLWRGASFQNHQRHLALRRAITLHSSKRPMSRART